MSEGTEARRKEFRRVAVRRSTKGTESSQLYQRVWIRVGDVRVGTKIEEKLRFRVSVRLIQGMYERPHLQQSKAYNESRLAERVEFSGQYPHCIFGRSFERARVSSYQAVKYRESTYRTGQPSGILGSVSTSYLSSQS